MYTVCYIHGKKEGTNQHLLGMRSSFLGFFFLENTQDNSGFLCAEQGAWGTEVEGDFPLHTLLITKPCEFKKQNKTKTDH